MPSAADVRPEKWSNITILFDDGEYSVISGIYEQRKAALGERWNGPDDSLGFPNVAGNPVWHVVPDFLAIPILHGLLDELSRQQNSQPPERAAAIMQELVERLRTT
jgi:hypothetical protein